MAPRLRSMAKDQKAKEVESSKEPDRVPTIHERQKHQTTQTQNSKLAKSKSKPKRQRNSKILKGLTVEKWVFEKIVSKRINAKTGVTEYEVKWKNYDSSENTWEPKEVFTYPAFVRRFENKLAREAKRLNIANSGRRNASSTSTRNRRTTTNSNNNTNNTSSSTKGRKTIVESLQPTRKSLRLNPGLIVNNPEPLVNQGIYF